jgi:hypothetical protein
MRVVFAAMLVLIGACVPPYGDIDPPDEDLNVCDENDDCASDEVCVAGSCVIGTCDPSQQQACNDGTAIDRTRCCARRELCSSLSFTCVEDLGAPPLGCTPEDITCVQCVTQDDCLAGQLCTAGLCLDTADLDLCTSSFQCSESERCDRSVFLCTPKRPCATCGPLAQHLCCFEGEVCVDDDQGGTCVGTPDPECTVETETKDCNANEFCDALARCSACDAEHPCGAGLSCDFEAGECVSP